jgi:hypothetical protein
VAAAFLPEPQEQVAGCCRKRRILWDAYLRWADRGIVHGPRSRFALNRRRARVISNLVHHVYAL